MSRHHQFGQFVYRSELLLGLPFRDLPAGSFSLFLFFTFHWVGFYIKLKLGIWRNCSLTTALRRS